VGSASGIWHIAKLVLATKKHFLDETCLLFSQGKTALRSCLIYSKRNTHPLHSPLVLFTRVFLGVVSVKGGQKYPQATPTKITPGIRPATPVRGATPAVATAATAATDAHCHCCCYSCCHCCWCLHCWCQSCCYCYGWIPHNAGFGFLDLAPSILHSNWFWDYIS
jgi:hypothetical protein